MEEESGKDDRAGEKDHTGERYWSVYDDWKMVAVKCEDGGELGFPFSSLKPFVLLLLCVWWRLRVLDILLNEYDKFPALFAQWDRTMMMMPADWHLLSPLDAFIIYAVLFDVSSASCLCPLMWFCAFFPQLFSVLSLLGFRLSFLCLISFATNIFVLHRTKQTSEKEEGRVLLLCLVMELTTKLCPS